MRASDAARERTVSLLGDRFAEGYLSTDTFVDRVVRAYEAKSEDELDALRCDLPRPRSLRARLRDWLNGSSDEVEARLPAAGRLVYLGRSSSCDVVLAGATVSRVHAALEGCDGTWEVRDLGSTNGTLVNRRRVSTARVWPGDELQLGERRVRLRRPTS